MAKRTTITVEADSLLVLRGRGSLRARCPQCGVGSDMIPLNEVGVISNLPQSEVQSWLESEDLHHAVAVDGSPMICVNSLIKRVHKTETAFSV